jgi:hypothetical protein
MDYYISKDFRVGTSGKTIGGSAPFKSGGEGEEFSNPGSFPAAGEGEEALLAGNLDRYRDFDLKEN